MSLSDAKEIMSAKSIFAELCAITDPEANTEKFSEILEHIKHGLDKYPDNSDYKILEAIINIYTKRDFNVTQDLKNIIESPNATKIACDLIAIAYAKLGDIANSSYFAKLQMTMPDHADFGNEPPSWIDNFQQAFMNIESTPHYNRGLEAYLSGKYDIAIDNFYQASRQKQNDIDIWIYLVQSLLAVNRLHEALVCLQLMQQLAPDNIDIMCHAGRILAQIGENDAVLNCFNQIFDHQNVSYYHYGVYLYLLQNFLHGNQKQINEAEHIFAQYAQKEINHTLSSIGGLVDFQSSPDVFRIGILSRGFFMGGGLEMMLATLCEFKHPQVNIFLYNDQPFTSYYYRRLTNVSSQDYETYNIDDYTLATIMRNDSLHVLIDLDAYAHEKRYLISHLRPAPIICRLQGNNVNDNIYVNTLLHGKIDDEKYHDDHLIGYQHGLFSLPNNVSVNDGIFSKHRASLLKKTYHIGLQINSCDIQQQLLDYLLMIQKYFTGYDIKFIIHNDYIGGDARYQDAVNILTSHGININIDKANSMVNNPYDVKELTEKSNIILECKSTPNLYLLYQSLIHGQLILFVPSQKRNDELRFIDESFMTEIGLHDYIINQPNHAVDAIEKHSTPRGIARYHQKLRDIIVHLSDEKQIKKRQEAIFQQFYQYYEQSEAS